MKRAGALLMVLTLALIGCGGGDADSPQAVVNESVSVIDELGNILATIQDEASAKAANAKLEKLVPRVEKLKANMKKLEESMADGNFADIEGDERMAEAMQRYFMQMLRLTARPDLTRHIEETFAKLDLTE